MNRAQRRAAPRSRQAVPPFPGVTCDSCGERFEPRLVEEPDLRGGVVGRFTCPHCSTTTEAYRIDAEGLAAREELKTVDNGSPRAVELHAILKQHVTRGGR
jgi:hypothetical protein